MEFLLFSGNEMKITIKRELNCLDISKLGTYRASSHITKTYRIYCGFLLSIYHQLLMMQLFIFRFFALVLNIFLYYRFATPFADGVDEIPISPKFTAP